VHKPQRVIYIHTVEGFSSFSLMQKGDFHSVDSPMVIRKCTSW